VKTAISIPDPLFESAETLARRLRISRSQLYAEALRALVERHEEERMRAVLDDLYGAEPSDLPEGAMEAQASILSEWRDESDPTR
jgi:metal-responsive CopG/Arc/MetJ family transcriptional regulator